MSSFEISSVALTSGSAEFELVTASHWQEKWTARDTASVRLQLLGRVLCCRNKPRIRWIRSKGAILVLLWNCLIVDFYGNLPVGPIVTRTLQRDSSQARGEIFLLVTLVQALSRMILYPLAGWIADVYFGRYRVIKASLWLMWTGTILLSTCLCINMLVSPEKVHTAVKAVLLPIALLAMEAGITGFTANSVPFGIDQLPTGSEDQLSAFITWHIFTLFANVFAVSFTFSCQLLSGPSDTFLLQMLFQALLLTVALILDSLCRHWLVTEPHTANPFKLVAGVLRYACKNKRPQFRSAFTYQEDIKPSRVEYAKSSYGGPFSTEQVEDVKTFLRIVFALIPMGATIVLDMYAGKANTVFSNHMNPSTLSSCYAYEAVSNFAVIMLIAVPLYEFFLQPFLYNYVPSMLTRVGIGIFFTALSYVSFFSIDLAKSLEKKDGGTNYTCPFDDSSPPHQSNINPFWAVLPGSLAGLGNLIHAIAIYQFVFSQSPSNMKGLLMGAIFGTTGIFYFLGLAVLFPFYMGYTNGLITFPTCGSVYTLLLLVLTVVWFVVYVLVARGYRKREREETKRQQDYSEEYYSKYLKSKH